MTAAQICKLFNSLFSDSHNTILVGGAAEPLYKVAVEDGDFHKIVFRENFVASALHEISHWCIAGRERRQLEDYGYWYSQDRDMEQQLAFEKAEARPQALEWLLSVAADVPFRVSCDNFDTAALDIDGFRHRVHQQVLVLLGRKLPARAARLAAGFASVSAIADYTDHRHYLTPPK